MTTDRNGPRLHPGFPSGHRDRSLARMASEVFDVVIAGGGINGAGIARDLALRAEATGRPISIALLDKGHFSAGTSGRNSQMVHGGLRYLKYLEFRLVREALKERATLLRIAHHLVQPLPLLLPFYSGFHRRFYGTGLWMYDWLAGDQNVGRRSFLTPAQVAALEPGLARQGLHSAAIFFDCRMQASRLLLENLFEAARLGAAVANYTRARSWERREGGFAVRAIEEFSGHEFVLRARRLVDARGPWDDSGSVRLVRGSHIILPRLNRSDNAIAWFGPDGRIIFVIPWGAGRTLSLVGTTDVDHHGSPDEVHVSAEEVRYLEQTVRRLFPDSPPVEPVAAYSSLRPLIAGSGSATAASRSHRIWIDEDGVLKLAGGKYTTYRAMAAEACDLLFPELRGACRTAESPLANALENVPDDCLIEHAVSHEMALRLSDVIYASSSWGHEHRLSRENLAPFAAKMATLTGWDQLRTEDEIECVLRMARMPGQSGRTPQKSLPGAV